MSGILILGAGGHGKVIADILLLCGSAVRGFLDDDESLWGSSVLGLPVLGPISSYADHAPDGLIAAIGANTARWALVERLDVPADLWVNAVHPRAIVASSALLGRGIVIAAGAIVNPAVAIDDHAIINTSASVDHDSHIAAYAHIGPGARLAGGVSIGAGALIGVGATIIPDRRIGAWATVGAGAVVVRDVPDGVVATGVPARW